MQARRHLSLAAALPLLVAPMLSAAPARADDSKHVWLVELAAGAEAADLETTPGVELRHDFDRIWNGVSLEADAATAHGLESLDRVERVWADVTFNSPSLPESEPTEMARATETTNAADAHARGVDGTGLEVGVIDTGIDYTHPDLGGCFGPGCRVELGTDLVGDDYDADDPDNAEPVPDDDPADCAGHGTHVAGIVGADRQAAEGVTGAAPGVTFGAYKVFGCEGSTSAEVIMQALEAALDDGMDVVNLSLGQSFQWPGYPTAEAADSLADEGVVVTASIGNSGEAGIWSASAPGVGTDVIGVASTDNPVMRMSAAYAPDLDRRIGHRTIDQAPEPEPGTTSDPLVWLGRGCADDESAGDVEGGTALIVRGGCTFAEKYERAVSEGATAVVVHNDRPGPFGGSGAENLEVPLVAVTDTDGRDLRDLAEIGAEPVLEWKAGTATVDLPRGGQASMFTSWGPAPDLGFKPDLSAPGGGIWSTYPVDEGSYRSLSGTSMAAPHVAGAAALLLQAEPGLDPAAVRDRLANSARPVMWGENPELGYLEAVHRQGTGVIDVTAALDAPGALTPTGINVGDGVEARTFEVELASASNRTESYRMGHQTAIATTGDIRDTGYHVAAPEVDFEPKTVELGPGETAKVTVTIAPNAELPEGSVFGGRVLARPEQGRPLAAAYSGYFGNYLDIPVLEHPDYPKLAAVVDEDPETGEAEFRDLREDEEFSLSDDRLPAALIYLGHMPRALEATVENADTGEVFEWDREEYLQRSPGPDDTAVIDLADFEADRPDVLEPGRWRLEIRVLKALGDEANPDHWEQWRSPVIRTVELSPALGDACGAVNRHGGRSWRLPGRAASS